MARLAGVRIPLPGLSFDGITSFVSLGTMGSFGSSLGSGIYFSFQFVATNAGARQAIAGTNNTGGPEVDIFLNWNGTIVVPNALCFNMRDSTAKRLEGYITNSTLCNGQPHTVTITVTPSTNTIVITVDGVTQTVTYVSQQTPATFVNFVRTMLVGAWNNNGVANNSFSGIIGNFQIGTSAGALYGNYALTEQAGTTITDTSGQGNTGTFGGYGGQPSGPPVWTNNIASGRFTVSSATPVPIIIDSDSASDIDDYGAFTCAFRQQLAGYCTILGINVDTSAANSPGAIDAMRKYLGLSSIPISSHAAVGTFLPVAQHAAYLYVYNNFSHDVGLASTLSTPNTNFRTLLAARTKADVVMLGLGYGNDLAALLQSAGDGISPLTGVQLVAASCKLLVWTGGIYPSGTDPANFARDLTDAAYVINNWPTPIIFFPGGNVNASIGGDILAPNPLSSLSALSPCKACYQQFGSPDNGHACWDLLTTMIGIEGTGAWQLVGPGTNVLNTSTGANTFTIGAGNHYYVNTNQPFSYYQNHFTELLKC